MPRSVTSRILLSLGVLALLALPVASMLRPAPPARPLESKRVLVTAFENRTGDASLDQLGGLAADWIADGLLRSGTVEVIDPVTAYYAVRDVQADKSISHDNSGRLRALGEAGSAGMVVWGAIDAVSDSVVFVVRVSDVEAGRLLETFRVAVPAVLAATAGVSTLREVVAGSVAAHSDSTLGALVGKEFAPPRLEAYREFRRGLDHFRPLRYREALDAFLTAARLDSTFTLPLVWAAYAAGNVRAWATRDSLEEVMRGILDRDKGRFSPLDRLALVSFTAHDGSARQEAIVEAARLAPGSNWTYLSGRNGWRLGPAIAALEAVDRRRGWAAGWMWVYHELARAYHFAGDYDRQLAVTREYAALYPWRRDAVRWLEVTALAALGREAELDRLLGVIEAGYDTSQVGWAPDQLMIEAGRELRAHGRNAAAELFLARADRWIEAHRATLDTLSFRYWRAKTDVAFYRERWEEAERLYRQVLEDSGDRGWWAVVQLSVVAALQGRRDEALKLWDEYLKRWPPPRRTERLFRARVSAALGEGDEAVRFFSEAVTLTEGVGGARTHLEVPYLHGPEWRRIANHPGYRALFKR
jgi:tetratricopeptide (TPR) repeat protein